MPNLPVLFKETEKASKPLLGSLWRKGKKKLKRFGQGVNPKPTSVVKQREALSHARMHDASIPYYEEASKDAVEKLQEAGRLKSQGRPYMHLKEPTERAGLHASRVERSMIHHKKLMQDNLKASRLHRKNETSTVTSLGAGIVAGTGVARAFPSDKRVEKRKQHDLNYLQTSGLSEKQLRDTYGHVMSRANPEGNRGSALGSVGGFFTGALASRKFRGLAGKPLIAGLAGGILGGIAGDIYDKHKFAPAKKKYEDQLKGMTRDQILHHIKTKVETP